MKILAIIPARGGSKMIPRKNVRFIAGKPLISYAIQCAKSCAYDMDLFVSTDDEEISYVARKYGADILKRPLNLAEDSITLDPVIYHAVTTIEEQKQYVYDIVITIQPTSPLLRYQTLDSAIEKFICSDLDTIISGINEPRLSWMKVGNTYMPKYKQRLNRQYLPEEFKETGAFVITKREFVTQQGRFGKNVSIYEVPAGEAVDIDSSHDWVIAERELMKKKILIRVEGYEQIGLGHVYRGLQIAASMIEHDVKFVISEKSKLGIEKLRQNYYQMEVIKENTDFIDMVKREGADIVINDILDTKVDYIKQLKALGVRVINFEDTGEGGYFADVLINALLDCDTTYHNAYWGPDYYLIRDEFMMEQPKEFSESVKEILAVFGGVDPNNITKRAADALLRIVDEYSVHATIILGMGYEKKEEIEQYVFSRTDKITILKDVKLISKYMRKGDLAIASRGRTMYELAVMGVPTVVVAENEREMVHNFGSIENGILNLGLEKDVDAQMLYDTLKWLIELPQIRENMRSQMLQTELKHGMKRVRALILDE